MKIKISICDDEYIYRESLLDNYPNDLDILQDRYEVRAFKYFLKHMIQYKNEILKYKWRTSIFYRNSTFKKGNGVIVSICKMKNLKSKIQIC